MKILCLHPCFPGQFKHLIPKLLERGDLVWAIRKPGYSNTQIDPALKVFSYKLKRGNGKDVHPLVLETESKVLRGVAVADVACRLRDEGLLPDLILGHPGWGDMLFMSDVWPEVPQLHYLEFFHGVPGTDHDIEDRYTTKNSIFEAQRTRMKNANLLLNLDSMDLGWTPTQFQKSVFPEWVQSRTSVIHDGIDTNWLIPNEHALLPLPNGNYLRVGDPVVTFINRTFEPYRGIHIFLEAIHRLQQKIPSVHTVLVGADIADVSYGARRSDGRGWLSALMSDMTDSIDWSRVHCLGTVSHDRLLQVYQVSSAHVYLTYPFVLSWSMLEAMSCGCLLVGSSTSPVEEVLQDGQNGFLVDFQDSAGLANILETAIHKPHQMSTIRKNARITAFQYDIRQCLRKQLALIDYARYQR